MTLSFIDLLARADEEALAAFVGEAGARLLGVMGGGLMTPAKLREIAIGLHGPAGLLADAAHRQRLFGLLRPDEAAALLRAVGETAGNHPHVALARLRPRRGSWQEHALYDFFGLEAPRVETPEESPATAGSNPGYGLFPHQRRALHEVGAALEAPPHRVLLHMPTGSGKTRTAMHLVARHLRERERGLVVWLVYGEELCEQAASEFERAWSFLGDRPVQIHRFWGARELILEEGSDGLVVASLPKLYGLAMARLSNLAALARAATLVVVDEAHQAIAPTYALVIDALTVGTRTPLVGLSATPGRTWSDIEADEALSRFFARRKVTLRVEGWDNPVDYLTSEGYLAHARFEGLHHNGTLELTPRELRKIADDWDIPATVLRRLAEDEQRNVAILHRLDGLLRRHRRVLVFGATVAHADLLATVLRARGAEAYSISAATPPAVRRLRLGRYLREDDRPVVLCNYGVLTTGFDAPRTSAALIARPTKSLVLYSQMVGRALRGPRAGGNPEAEIITVLDRELPGFGSVAEAFTNWEDVWN